MTEDAKIPGKTSIFKQRGGIWSVVGLLLVGGIITLWWIQNSGDEPDNPTPSSYEAPRNLVVISIDTLRADHLGCYGYDKNTSPNIDAVANDGVVFERHYSCYPLTLPAHLTQLTGVSSLGHRVRDNLYHRLPDEIETLPELMQAQGFNTGAFVSAHTMKSGSGLERGFDVYDDEAVRTLAPGRLTVQERKAPETLALAGDWVSGQGSDRFFCFVHLFDPHAPYEPHAGMGDEFQGDNRARYDGEIAYADREIGRFLARLDELGVTDETLIVITSDHGEGLGDHNELTHGYYCYDTATHVPLIIKGAPGIKSARVPGVVRNYDLAPTLIELMGLDALEFGKQVHGVSLAPAMRDPNTNLELSAFIESHYAWLNANWAKIRGLRTDNALTLFAGDESLHSKGADQSTKQTDSKAVSDARSEITRLMNAWTPPRKGSVQVRESTPGSPYPGESPVAQSFDPESLNDTRDLPSPHQNTDVLRRYQEAELEYDAGRFALCAKKLRELLKTHDDFVMAHKLLASVNQGIVRNESEQLGKEKSIKLTRESVHSLRMAAKLARDHGQELARQSIERNLALLLMWLNDGDALNALAETTDDPAILWMRTLAQYRLSNDAGERADATENARKILNDSPDAGFVATAKHHLQMMEQSKPLALAPWEQ